MTLKRSFWILMALFVPTAIAMGRIDVDLRTVHAPHGIVSFEFCGFAKTCSAILEEWDGKGRESAMLSLGLDYLFMLAYAGVLCVGLLLTSVGLEPRLKRLVELVAAGSIVAGLADALENYSLIQIVLGGDTSTYGMRAGTFASVKFALAGISLLVWASLGVRRAIAGRS